MSFGFFSKRRIPLAVVLPRPARGAGTLIPSAHTPASLGLWVSLDEELSVLKLGRSRASQKEWVTLPGARTQLPLLLAGSPE